MICVCGFCACATHRRSTRAADSRRIFIIVIVLMTTFLKCVSVRVIRTDERHRRLLRHSLLHTCCTCNRRTVFCCCCLMLLLLLVALPGKTAHTHTHALETCAHACAVRLCKDLCALVVIVVSALTLLLLLTLSSI